MISEWMKTFFILLRLNAFSCSHVNRYTTKHARWIDAECLFRYDEPVSPHLAVQMKNGEGVVSFFKHPRENFVDIVLATF
jgi:hypothetical protein